MTTLSTQPVQHFSRGLAAMAKRQWHAVALKALVGTGASVLLLLLPGAMLLGFWPHTPVALRVLISTITWATLLYVSARWLAAIVHRPDLTAAAGAIEQQRDLKERLTSAVNLSGAAHGRNFVSPLLLAHLFRQADRDVENIQPRQLIQLRPIAVRGLMVLAVELAVWLTLFAAWTRPTSRGLYLLLKPWQSELPAVLSDIVLRPGNATIPAGDVFTAVASVHERSSTGVRLVIRHGDGAAQSYDMTSSGQGEFKFDIDDTRAPFSYQAESGGAHSAEFHVAVLPRPSVSAIDVRYEYPAYTGQPPLEQQHIAGPVTAVVGTQAILTIHTSGEVDPITSHLAVSASLADEASIAMQPVSGLVNAYRATIPIRASGSYRVRLKTGQGVSEKDAPAYRIDAVEDREPVVVIRSPSSGTQARPDDLLPVEFSARDDFGLASLECWTSVNGQPARASAIPFSSGARQHESSFQLDIASEISRAGASADEARQLTLWLRAADNRIPDPHVRESEHVTLQIDRGLNDIFAVRQARQQQEAMEQALRRALDRLNEAEPIANELKQQNRDRDRDSNWQKEASRRVREATQNLARASADLQEAARRHPDDAFSQVAEKAADVATGPLAKATDALGQTGLEISEPAARSKSADRSRAEIAQARKRLEELLNQVAPAARQAEAAGLIRQAARGQEALARQMSQRQAANADAKPADAQQEDKARQMTPEERQAQERLANQVEQAASRVESLRSPASVQAAAKLAELTQRVDQASRQQHELERRVDQQAEEVGVRRELADLARQQRQLNQDVANLAEERHVPIAKAGTELPRDGELSEIARELERANPQHAADMQQQAGRNLHQAAESLDRQAKEANAPAGSKETAQAANAVANRQDELAGQSLRLSQALAKSRQNQPSPTDLAARADELQREIDRIGQFARQVGEQVSKDSPSLAERVAAAAPRLKDAADAAQQTRDAQRAIVARQEAAQQAIGRSAAKDEERRQLAEQATTARREAERLDEQAGHANADDAKRLREQSQQADDRSRKAAALARERSLEADTEREKASQAGDAVQVAQDQAAEKINAADRALADAANRLRGVADESLSNAEESGKSPQASPNGGDQPQPGQQASTAKQARSSRASKPGAGADAGAEASQNVQEALAAQRQALANMPQAAQQAARALRQAASAMGSQGQAADQADADTDKRSSQASGRGSAPLGKQQSVGSLPGRSADSRQGASLSGSADNAAPPAAAALGISASDWAKLPPRVQGDVLSAAQQPGPPEYRQMIRDYYLRIAGLPARQDEAPPQGAR